MNIVYAGNQNVFKGMLLGTLSLLKHHKTPLTIYILTMTLSEVDPDYIEVRDTDVKTLDRLVKEVNKDSQVIKVDVKDLFVKELGQSPNAKTRYTAYTLLRLLLDKIDNMPSRLLYLDTDTLVNGNLESYFNMDLSKYEFAGSKDRYGKIFLGPRYLNAGVLLFNLEKMKETKLLEKCRAMLNKKEVFLSDQTALNKMSVSKLILPRRYNEQKKTRSNTLIRHFSMQFRLLPKFHFVNIKPWHVEKLHSVYKCHEFDDIINKYLLISKGEIK